MVPCFNQSLPFQQADERRRTQSAVARVFHLRSHEIRPQPKGTRKPGVMTGCRVSRDGDRVLVPSYVARGVCGPIACQGSIAAVGGGSGPAVRPQQVPRRGEEITAVTARNSSPLSVYYRGGRSAEWPAPGSTTSSPRCRRQPDGPGSAGRSQVAGPKGGLSGVAWQRARSDALAAANH